MQNLKTKLFTTLFLLSFPCFHTMAQQSEGGDEKRKLIRTELRVQTSRFAKEFRPYELTSAIGWNITSRFFANLQGEAAVALFKVDGKKDYSTNYTLGLNTGYTFVKNDLCSIDARIGAGTKLGKSDAWNYHYYDLGVMMHIGKGHFRPTCGIGLRHYKSHNDAFKDCTRIYAAVGMIFGG